MSVLREIQPDFDFSCVVVLTPSSPSYFRLSDRNGKELLVQPPVFGVRKGVTGTRSPRIDMVFGEMGASVFMDWTEKLTQTCAGMLCGNSQKWFGEKLAKEDVEAQFLSSWRKTTLMANVAQGMMCYSRANKTIPHARIAGATAEYTGVVRLTAISFANSQFQFVFDLMEMQETDSPPAAGRLLKGAPSAPSASKAGAPNEKGAPDNDDAPDTTDNGAPGNDGAPDATDNGAPDATDNGAPDNDGAPDTTDHGAQDNAGAPDTSDHGAPDTTDHGAPVNDSAQVTTDDGAPDKKGAPDTPDDGAPDTSDDGAQVEKGAPDDEDNDAPKKAAKKKDAPAKDAPAKDAKKKRSALEAFDLDEDTPIEETFRLRDPKEVYRSLYSAAYKKAKQLQADTKRAFDEAERIRAKFMLDDLNAEATDDEENLSTNDERFDE